MSTKPSKAPIFKELPIEQLEADHEQPRKDFEIDENDRLFLSIKEYGIEMPIAVHAEDQNRFIILDGHRRYRCAQKLNMEFVPCRIYSNLDKWEQEFKRFEIQNNRKEWQPIERSNSLSRIKENRKFSNKEVAELLHISTSTVSYSLGIRKQTIENVGLFRDYKHCDAYITEYFRLKPKLRKVKDIEKSGVTIALFEKVQNHIVKSAKDFRKLQPIFLRGEHNKDFLHEFLIDKDMTVEQLEERTQRFGPSLAAEKLILELGALLASGRVPPTNEIPVFKELGELCQRIVKMSKTG